LLPGGKKPRKLSLREGLLNRCIMEHDSSLEDREIGSMGKGKDMEKLPREKESRLEGEERARLRNNDDNGGQKRKESAS